LLIPHYFQNSFSLLTSARPRSSLGLMNSTVSRTIRAIAFVMGGDEAGAQRFHDADQEAGCDRTEEISQFTQDGRAESLQS